MFLYETVWLGWCCQEAEGGFVVWKGGGLIMGKGDLARSRMF